MATKNMSWAAQNLNTNPPKTTTTFSLSVDTPLSREGYFVLNWSSDASYTKLLLQQSDSAEFSAPTIKNISGDESITITGLADGQYYFRLVTGDFIVSNALSVRVEHHSMVRALSFFLLGFLLFAVLLLSIYRGHRMQEASDAG